MKKEKGVWQKKVPEEDPVKIMVDRGILEDDVAQARRNMVLKIERDSSLPGGMGGISKFCRRSDGLF